jgi:hypothetical protein
MKFFQDIIKKTNRNRREKRPTKILATPCISFYPYDSLRPPFRCIFYEIFKMLLLQDR